MQNTVTTNTSLPLLNFAINTKSFLYHLSFAHSVLQKKSLINVSNQVQIKARDNQITLFALDNDLHLTQTFSAKILQEGAFVAPAAILLDIVRKIGHDEVVIEQISDTQLKLCAPRCEFNLVINPQSIAPATDSLDWQFEIKLSVAELLVLIDSTAFAICSDESRLNISGLCVIQEDEYLKAVSSDGHRLAFAQIWTNANTATSANSIIPRRTVFELTKILKDQKNNAGLVRISCNESRIEFEYNKIILRSRLVHAQFPNYKNFLPSGLDKTLTIDTHQFIKVIERIAVINLGQFKSIKLQFLEDRMCVSSFQDGAGNAKEEVLYNKTEQEEVYCEVNFSSQWNIGFNPKYLIEALQTIRTTKTVISLHDEYRPIKIQPENNDNIFSIIMPVRI
ncbi:DNA polymerase III subunit beta [Rickettsiales endosymbiont of Paramecium tredecaurelia]|uniref:DNA polymerase III subunit beta n=1 Tax=Candidatus Sarmatiella mevalonica TaxID=2770581 RepID=UPI00192365E5|nr:DNA polymerase III subunit beta [Candidatus Sarmatiella mevalonica]MBL3284812.1 DNA polymerase III subunit beta [Candidatus Sarmatiella mevalonica]